MRCILLLFLLTFSAPPRADAEDKRYVFFLHNMFVEVSGLDAVHPEYGRCEYKEIIDAFGKEGFTVISEVRKKNTDGVAYARKVRRQVDSLIRMGVKPDHITVVGTSKGAFIAWHVSSLLKNKDVNFVLIGICTEGIVAENKGVDLCGNILSIYEHTDMIGQSCNALKSRSSLTIPHFKEIELNTGLKHGFLYKASPGWLRPAINWAKGVYTF